MERSRPANSNGGSPAVEPERIELRQVASPSPNPDPLQLQNVRQLLGMIKHNQSPALQNRLLPLFPQGARVHKLADWQSQRRYVRVLSKSYLPTRSKSAHVMHVKPYLVL